MTREEKIERIARAMAGAGGSDPDREVAVEKAPADASPHAAVTMRRVVNVPTWTIYTDEAVRFLAAMEAYEGFER